MNAILSSHLKKFDLFANFSESQCNFIIEHGKEATLPAKKLVLKQDSQLEIMFLLLEGELKLTATDGKEVIITSNCQSAKNPIARIRPSRYQVFSHTEVKLFILSESLLNKAIAIEEAETEAISLDTIEHSDKSYDVTLFNILTLLHTDQLVLPSLPDIAFKIRQVLENEDSSTKEIIKIINMDQSIVTKIIKTANSAMYNVSGKKIESIKDAFLRIGTKKLVNLVLSYSLKELFSTDSVSLKSKMKEVWQHSVQVAAIGSIMTRVTSGLDPEKALLAGLLHNIGAVALLNNLQNETSLLEDSCQLKKTLFDLQAEVGSAILTKWGFPNDLIAVAKYSTDWQHQGSEQFDYSDIVNIAQIHAFIGTDYQENLPTVEEMPAFKKLAEGKLTPQLSLQILKKSEKDIQQIIALFS